MFGKEMKKGSKCLLWSTNRALMNAKFARKLLTLLTLITSIHPTKQHKLEQSNE
jgi:hypothetical protein